MKMQTPYPTSPALEELSSYRQSRVSAAVHWTLRAATCSPTPETLRVFMAKSVNTCEEFDYVGRLCSNLRCRGTRVVSPYTILTWLPGKTDNTFKGNYGYEYKYKSFSCLISAWTECRFFSLSSECLLPVKNGLLFPLELSSHGIYVCSHTVFI